MRVLILDDDLGRLKAFKKALIGCIVKLTSETWETINALKEEKWDYLFLDHDLGGKIMVPSGPGTGYEVAAWLEEHPDRKPDK